MNTASISTERDDQQTLVVVFLRGGADGLTLVVPREDDHYYRARPRLSVKKETTLRLDDRFGLNQHLSPLEAAWKEGDLAIVHAAGCEDESRSHFEAQDFMEHGGTAAGGWLARFIRARGISNSPLSAVALAPTLPECLSGAPSAAAITSLDEFSLRNGKKKNTSDSRDVERFAAELRKLYDLESPGLRTAAVSTFEAMRRIEAIDPDAPAANGAVYDQKDSFHRGLQQTAQLIRADLGITAASVDLNGWDTHFTQDAVIDSNIKSLGSGLAAFRRDLGARMAKTTVVVMTEFGRRFAENTSFGTDHGRGSVMFLMGGGVRGGRVLGEWKGLTQELLVGPGDLPVLNNYRDVLAPILQRHGAPADSFGKIFPGHAMKPHAVYG